MDLILNKTNCCIVELVIFHNSYANNLNDLPAVLRHHSTPINDGIDVSNESHQIVLETQSGGKVVLPVGIGLTLTFWKKQNYENKKAIANHFECDTIGQFEEEILHVGHALAESDLAATPFTQSDVAIAIALDESEEMENSANDAYFATCVATEETGLVLFTLAVLL